MTNCKNCDAPVPHKYCSNCGQATTLKRIDRTYIFREIQAMLNFEKGIFYTAKELMIRPGKSIRIFIEENRSKHMKPLTFLIFTCLVYTLISHFFHADEKIIIEDPTHALEKSVLADILGWMMLHYDYLGLIIGIFFAWCLKLFFRKSPYNFFEILIALCFIIGQSMLLLTTVAFFAGVLSQGTFIAMMALISFVYSTWAIGQFFDKTRFMSYVKAFFAYILACLLFYIALILIGVSADLILRAL